MKKSIFLVIVSTLIFILHGCGTKTVAYFDVESREIIGNGNRIKLDSNLNLIGVFLLYSSNNSKEYKGIELDLSLTNDTLLTIDDLQVDIKPMRNTQSIKPVSFFFSNITSLETVNGADFQSVKQLLNKAKDKTVSILFEDDVEKYDSLYTHIGIRYSRLGRNYSVDKDKIYIKGYYKAPISR